VNFRRTARRSPCRCRAWRQEKWNHEYFLRLTVGENDELDLRIQAQQNREPNKAMEKPRLTHSDLRALRNELRDGATTCQTKEN